MLQGVRVADLRLTSDKEELCRYMDAKGTQCGKLKDLTIESAMCHSLGSYRPAFARLIDPQLVRHAIGESFATQRQCTLEGPIGRIPQSLV